MLSHRYRKVQWFKDHAIITQQQMLADLLQNLKTTSYGKKYQTHGIGDLDSYRKQVPIVEYDSLLEHIQRMMHGDENVLWPGKIKWFARSSGTTSSRSKFIPMSDIFIKKSCTKSGWDALSMYYGQDPMAAIFSKKSLILCGSYQMIPNHPSTMVGDVSSILLKKMPPVGTPYLFPSKQMQLEPDWDKKIEQFVHHAKGADVTMISGVPSWVLVVLEAIKTAHGLDHIHQIWPHLRLFYHGGVSLEPYKQRLAKLLPNPVHYMQGYNASEGYFAIQDEFGRDDMLLLTDHGIYYEFILLEDYIQGVRQTISLSEVQLNKNYVAVISTYSGLWRYVVGDTIKFVSTNPYRIQYTGRTQQHINMFGEELMIANTDKAISQVCHHMNISINEYSAAPILSNNKSTGRHHWVIEFNQEPLDLDLFSARLDEQLRSLNSDYDAKRVGDRLLAQLKVTKVPKGTFNYWLKERNKVGGQNKIPRLSNDSVYIDQFIKIGQKRDTHV